jgi:hypothetical protein
VENDVLIDFYVEEKDGKDFFLSFYCTVKDASILINLKK